MVKKVDVWKFARYFCKVKPINIKAGKHIILLNEDEAKNHDIYLGYKTKIRYKRKSAVATVDTTKNLIKKGEVGVYSELMKELSLKNGDTVEIVHIDRPESIRYIRKKMDGNELTEKEIKSIISDLMDEKLSEIELTAWITAVHIYGLNDREIISLTEAIVDSGESLNLRKKVKVVADKHSIGGVAGNRVTMVLVPIIAAAGIHIPKSSSRAITSAAGTADVMEILAPVDLGLEELERVVMKTKGAIVWGGGLNLASADDKLIKIRNPLSLDPEGLLLSSILAKKKAVSATHVVIDIPVGRGAKIDGVESGKKLAEHFIRIGENGLGMDIKALVTDGSEPIGCGVGPALEARDVLRVLEGNGPRDLMEKSCLLAGKLLEMVGKVEKGRGYAYARKMITSGKALGKLKEIIEAQGGNPRVSSSDMPIGEFSYDIISKKSGKISHIDNKIVAKIAKIAGSPVSEGAGVYLHKSKGDRVRKGDKLMTIFADSEERLSFAIKSINHLNPIEMQKLVLDIVD